MDCIRVQRKAFSAAQEYAALSADAGDTGAVVLFVGKVRSDGEENPVVALELEHYPDMTERVLEQLVRQARERWQLGRVRLVHRVGRVALGEDIVLVAVSAPHRREAFAAAEYLMDKLKSVAPFWKKERRRDGAETWVAAKPSDEKAASRWDD